MVKRRHNDSAQVAGAMLRSLKTSYVFVSSWYGICEGSTGVALKRASLVMRLCVDEERRPLEVVRVTPAKGPQTQCRDTMHSLCCSG